jgi:hypothetical protein
MTTGVAIVASLLALPLYAQTGTSANGEFTLQGRLTTNGGTAVANGAHTLAINVYDRTTGSLVYSETDNVTTTDGIFTTMVGDNGSGNSKLMVNANTQYDLGVAVDNQTEMSPRLQIGSALRAATADVAANAMAVGGVSLRSDTNRFNSLVTTNAQGYLSSNLLDTTMLTSINGVRGPINLTGGGNLNVSTSGNTVSLSFNGDSSGSFNLPYSQTLNLGTGQTGFALTNSGAGSAAAFLNTGAGTALNLQSVSGSAINATSNAGGSATGTINVSNMGGTAINAVGNASTGAVLRLQNTSSGTQGTLISAMDSNSNVAFSVMTNGRTTIRSTADNALDVGTSASGGTALKLNGGLVVNGPAGTGTVDLSNGSTAISNAYVKANSIILVTPTTATSAASVVPLRISSQGNGTFTVSAITGALGSLTGSLSFNYLIINQ